MSDATNDVRGWVDEAYPEGIPAGDAAAFVSVLRQRLGDGPGYRMALDLVARGRLDAAAAIGEEVAPPTAADLRRVSAALVLGGWPLGGAAHVEDEDGDDTEPGSYLGRIISWLRVGYPYGVPEHDYQPLLAILERRLTRGEVKKVAKALRRAGAAPAGPDDIAAAIADLTHSNASEADLQRVRARLTKKGWPVEFPDPDAE
jgi:hypothetical protein